MGDLCSLAAVRHQFDSSPTISPTLVRQLVRHQSKNARKRDRPKRFRSSRPSILARLQLELQCLHTQVSLLMARPDRCTSWKITSHACLPSLGAPLGDRPTSSARAGNKPHSLRTAKGKGDRPTSSARREQTHSKGTYKFWVLFLLFFFPNPMANSVPQLIVVRNFKFACVFQNFDLFFSFLFSFLLYTSLKFF